MISIIVPVYNAESVLERCIKSILAQTYTDIELLLINDGSSDSSEAICKRYSEIDSRVHLYTKKNGGSASARNYGIRVSKGEYIQFVDADDLIEKNMTEKLHRALTDNDVDWVICGVKLISLRRTSLNLFGDYCCKSREEICDVIIKYYTKAICHSCWNKLYKKSFITSLMEVKYVYGEDYIFNLNYMKNIHSLVTINEALYVYDCRNESVTRGKNNNKEETIKEQFDISYDIFTSLFDSEQLNSVITTHFFNDLIMNFVHTHSVFEMNKSMLENSISDYIKCFKRINNTNTLQGMIEKGAYGNAIRYMRKLRIRFVMKEICKRIIGRLRR